MRPWLMDLLTEQQRKDWEAGRARFVVAFANLPEEIRTEVTRLAARHPEGRRTRIVSGGIVYEPDTDRPLAVTASFHTRGWRRKDFLSFQFPARPEEPGRGRFGPRPDIVVRTDIERTQKEVSVEEFQTWWDWAQKRIAPLARAPMSGTRGGTHTSARLSSLGERDLQMVRQYLLEVPPRPVLSKRLTLGPLVSGFILVVHSDTARPDALAPSVSVSAKFSAAQEGRVHATLYRPCPAAGGSLVSSWSQKGKTVEARVTIWRNG